MPPSKDRSGCFLRTSPPRSRFGCFTCFCFGGFSFSLHCWVILRRFYWARGFSITTCAASGLVRFFFTRRLRSFCFSCSAGRITVLPRCSAMRFAPACFVKTGHAASLTRFRPAEKLQKTPPFLLRGQNFASCFGSGFASFFCPRFTSYRITAKPSGA